MNLASLTPEQVQAIRAGELGAVMGRYLGLGFVLLAIALVIAISRSQNVGGVAAVVALSFCLSLMFPTIYGVALAGFGPATKFGAAA